MRNFMQCCYTRLGGQAIGSGWQAVACSDNIPMDVQKAYGTFQNAHVLNSTPLDEAGNPLNLFDVSVIGDYLYLTRIRYGLFDELNRQNNMFAHTFIFSMKDDELIKNPNTFLTICDGNFKVNEEEAGVIPETLERRADFTLEEALEICHLDDHGYETLIQCVYAQVYANKEKKPLYISGVQNDEQVRALLYCIYRGIPYSMRRSLSCATANLNAALKYNLIISNKYGNADLYLDIRTGSTNILLPRVISRFARYGYVTAFPKGFRKQEMETFFDRLEEMAVRLGNPGAADATILKIAYQMMRQPQIDEMVEAYSEDDLHEKINEALTARSEKSVFMDGYIAVMLSKISREGYLLSEEEDDALTEKLNVTESDVLQMAGEQYKIHYLSQMAPEKAAEKMRSIKGETFRTYSRKLAGLPSGKEIMDIYYSRYYLKADYTWESLEEMLEETSYIKEKPQTVDAMEGAAWNLYTKTLEEEGDCRQAYNAYEAFMYRVSRGASIDRVCNSAKEEYWEHVTLENFDLKKENEYRFFEISGSEKAQFIMELIGILYRAAEKGLSDRLLFSMARLASRNRKMFDEKGKSQVLALFTESSAAEKGWYAIAFGLMDEALMDDAIRLSGEVKNSQSEYFLSRYPRFQRELLTSNRNLKDVSQDINDRLILIAEKWDAKTNDHAVLLDHWLLLGKYKYDNPFRILDEVSANIMDDDAEEICESSWLLQEEEYQDFAEEYVRDGSNAKQVKEWLSLLRKQQKLQKKADKQADRQAEKAEKQVEKQTEKQQSAVAGFMSRFTQKAGNTEPPEDNSAKKKKKGFWDRR